MNKFKKNITSLFGAEGKKWLFDLPKLTDNISNRLELSELTPVTNLSYNYVLSGIQHHKPIILKLGLDIPALKNEALALKIFSEYGAVKVIKEEEGLLLLERALPGYSLDSYFPIRDNEATEVVISLIKKLHQAPVPVDINFPTIIDWLTALDRGEGLPNTYLEKARRLKSKLINTCSTFNLLHGDLHHYNILRNQEEWVTIDPKGVMGESAYEIAYYIRNPIPFLLESSNREELINHRVNLFAQAFGIAPQRILEWCFVQSVLAWTWAIEDHGPVSKKDEDSNESHIKDFKDLTTIFDKLVI